MRIADCSSKGSPHAGPDLLYASSGALVRVAMPARERSRGLCVPAGHVDGRIGGWGDDLRSCTTIVPCRHGPDHADMLIKSATSQVTNRDVNALRNTVMER